MARFVWYVPHRPCRRQSSSGTGAAFVQCMRSPTPYAGSVQSTPRWHQRSTKASLLSRGSLTRYHSEHKPPALRSPLPTNSQPCWRAARMCARVRADTARAHCCVPALPGVPQAGR